MEDDKIKENVIQMTRSNHFVQEYLAQMGIAEKIKRNPRFQSIIWHISVMLKRQEIDFTRQEAVKWIQDNIKIGEEGKEIGYVISGRDGYYPCSFALDSTIQFVKYFQDKEGMKRQVKEMRGQEETMQILSQYNQDGIEECQWVEDKQRGDISRIERIENRPELKVITQYDKKTEEIVGIDYEKRFFWVGLEDFAPNLIELDPIGTRPILKYERIPFYLPFSMKDKQQIKHTNNLILPLAETNREGLLQEYKELNKKYHRINVFENGMAKMLKVQNRDISK